MLNEVLHLTNGAPFAQCQEKICAIQTVKINLNPRQEATIKQLDAQIEKTEEEIMRLVNVKANLKSKINSIKQKDGK